MLKNKIINLLLTIILIALIIIISVLGYVIYNFYINNQTGQEKILTLEEIAKLNDIEETNENIGLYYQLNEYAKNIYDELYANKENLKSGTYTINFKDKFSDLLSQEEGTEKLKKSYQSAIETFIYSNPDTFYLEPKNMNINIEKTTKLTGITYNVYIDKGENESYLSEGFNSKEDVAKAVEQIEQVRSKVLSLLENKSDYDKIKIIHDYLIDNISYDTTISKNHIYNIYGALVNKECVCEGYAKAFQYLANSANIENVIVLGKATNSDNITEEHSWNYVKLNNYWYAIDVTWDDSTADNKGKITNKQRYRYFLKGSNTMKQNHLPIGIFTEDGQEYKYPNISKNDYK